MVFLLAHFGLPKQAVYTKLFTLSARKAHPERWSKGIRKWDRPGIVALNPRDRKKDRQQEVA
jgi:hypothetical protein